MGNLLVDIACVFFTSVPLLKCRRHASFSVKTFNLEAEVNGLPRLMPRKGLNRQYFDELHGEGMPKKVNSSLLKRMHRL